METLLKEKTKQFEFKELDITYHEGDPNWPEHSYSRNRDGKLLAGVSSVSELASKKDKSFYLNQWAANCAVNDIWQQFCQMKTRDQYGNVLVNEKIMEDILFAQGTGAKTAHLRLSKEAKEIGKNVHDLLQQYIQGKIEGRKVKLEVRDEDIKRAITQFVQWEKANKVRFLASELLVGDPEGMEVAGRLDCLALVNGKRTLIDWKVANNLGENYFVQLAGYWHCLEVMGWQPEERILVRIPKTATRKVWNNDIKKYEVKENNLEVLAPPTEIEFDKQTFQHCREVYRWLNQKALDKSQTN